MKKSLYEQIDDALKARQTWADRQQVNYTMRNGGVRRRAKPYPNAPDGWYPLGDTMIEKLKPAHVQFLYAADTIANFVCLRQQDSEQTAAATYWFDYQLKQRSNFERTMFVAIDQMLEQGFTPVKVYWDATCKRLAWEQVDPLHLIVPASCQEYNKSGGTDWMVHILHLTVAEYKANSNFNQDPEFIDRIKGKGKSQESGDEKRWSVDLKEGINCSNDDNEIVLWECYNRDRKDHKITVETISPLLPCEDEENVARPSFGLPYNRGCFKGGEHFPFFKMRAEIKGKGHYSSRGIIEINSPFEASLTKNLNTLNEWQDFFEKPMFENSGTSPIPNSTNFKTGPGKILPAGLKPVSMPDAPSSIRENMDMMRAIAEDRTRIPDLGANQHLEGGQSSGGKVTATQINAIVGASSQGSDLRARVFKLDLGEGLQMGWSIALQYLVTEETLMYLVDGERQTLDQNAIHEDYEITPNGSADSWNKGALVAKRMAYYQTLLENPFIDKAELTKWLLEADDPTMVKRLFQDPQVATKSQEQQQVLECIEMEVAGYVPDVNESDDAKTHLMILDQFAKKKIADGSITPPLAQALIQHGTAHMGQLLETKDPMRKQIEARLKPTAEALAIIAAQGQPNVIQMQQPAGEQGATNTGGPLSPTGPAGAATQELQPQMAGTP